MLQRGTSEEVTSPGKEAPGADSRSMPGSVERGSRRMAGEPLAPLDDLVVQLELPFQEQSRTIPGIPVSSRELKGE